MQSETLCGRENREQAERSATEGDPADPSSPDAAPVVPRPASDSAGDWRSLCALIVGRACRCVSGRARCAFADLTVQRKLIVLILSIGAVAVVVEFGVFLFYQRCTLRSDVVSEVETLTRSLAADTAADIASGNRSAAQSRLAGLTVDHRLLTVRLLDGGGQLFAEFRRSQVAEPPAAVPPDSLRFGNDALTVNSGIFLMSRRVGSITVAYDLAAEKARLRRRLQLGAGLLLVSIVIRILVVMRLTRMVTDPLGYLAAVARTISLRRDYSIRAERRTGGEIGLLIDDFNEMLSEIERHDQARLAAETSLRESEQRYALAARGSHDGLWDWRTRSGKVYLSARCNVILGQPDEDSWETHVAFLGRIHPQDRQRVHAEFAAFARTAAGVFAIECRVRRRDGNYVWVSGQGTAVRDTAGNVVRTAGSLRDITATKVFDSVTGLPNQLLFVEKLDAALEKGKRAGTQVAVLFLDLERFRMIRDGLGRTAGDELLRQVAGRLRSTTRGVGPEIVVARTGDDEFAVMLPHLLQTSEASTAARRMLDGMREPFYIEGQRLSVGTSIGIAFGSGADVPEELLRNAETAMYSARPKRDAQVTIFNRSMRERAQQRLAIVNGLERAIGSNELRLRYQPLVSARARRIVGFESLVRWRHPERGLLRPGEFISVAEESDLILAVGEWVLRDACRQMAEWQHTFAPDPPLTIGVNVAARQMNHPGFAGLVAHILEETGMDPRLLRLEMTESSLATDFPQILTTLRALRRMHVQLVIDDFGTGYSSMSYLQRLPFNTLKIDRSFVRELGAENGSPEIVRAIIRLARSFKLKVVAEGVESALEVTRLMAMKCDLLQGFYFGKPMPAEGVAALLRDGHGLRPLFPRELPEETCAAEQQPSDNWTVSSFD